MSGTHRVEMGFNDDDRGKTKQARKQRRISRPRLTSSKKEGMVELRKFRPGGDLAEKKRPRGRIDRVTQIHSDQEGEKRGGENRKKQETLDLFLSWVRGGHDCEKRFWKGVVTGTILDEMREERL